MQAGKPLLHIAAQGGNIELVDWLIEEHKFDVHLWINVSAGIQPCAVCTIIAYTKCAEVQSKIKVGPDHILMRCEI